MLRFKSLPLLMGVFAAVFSASHAQGSIVKALDLEQLVDQSEQIVLGRVMFSESFVRANGNLGTWHRIQIERDIRGNAPVEGEVIVETLGGQMGDIAMRVEGEPSFSMGERVVVFIRDGGPYTAFRTVGMGQGVMRITTRAGIDTVTQTREGMVLMRRNTQGFLEKTHGALPDEERLDVFLSRVRALVDREAGEADE